MDIWEREDFAKSSGRMKIFIEAMHGMGDVVCMLPMFREVRENWPDSQITVLVQNKGIMDVVRLSGLNIDRIIGINAHMNKFEFLRLLLKLRREKFSLSISAAGTPLLKARLVSWIIGAKKKAGIRFDKKKFASYGSTENYHFVDLNLLVLEQLRITNHHYSPRLFPDPQDVAKFVHVIDRSRPVIGVAVGRADAFRGNRIKNSKLYTREWGGGYTSYYVYYDLNKIASRSKLASRFNRRKTGNRNQRRFKPGNFKQMHKLCRQNLSS